MDIGFDFVDAEDASGVLSGVAGESDGRPSAVVEIGIGDDGGKE